MKPLIIAVLFVALLACLPVDVYAQCGPGGCRSVSANYGGPPVVGQAARSRRQQRRQNGAGLARLLPRNWG